MQGSLGPLTWLVCSEIFPLRIRSMAIGISVLALWLANALVALVFPPIVEGIGIASTFFIFVVLGLVALAFVHTMVPETRGRSLEQLEAEFRERYS
ncbi:MFS transporter [Pseudonocardia sp. NPDC046786]|uniref:MFS transporter n=1 Tax=Pseudonocardia sp. NPDC046786 TaxID=3155471 RepID=UPI0033EC6126